MDRTEYYGYSDIGSIPIGTTKFTYSENDFS